MWQSVGLTFLVFVATLICVLLFMLCGWYVVWHLFLSKFKFLRELVCDSGSLQGDSESSSSSSSSSSSVSESEPSSTPQRTRPKTARQRKIPADEAT
ncbi:small integral membrane protein 13 [Ranitomeya variabilis]|uniref:small integral membrane protein 13 n=1 Tax=Ranitomeya variabilis TaxID=490064 RepID=UPI004055D6C9